MATTVVPTELSIPNLIQNFNGNGIVTFALTSRSREVPTTYKQLDSIGVKFSIGLSGEHAIPAPHPAFYKNGVIFWAITIKATSYCCSCEQHNLLGKRIVFVDNKQKLCGQFRTSIFRP